MSKYAIITNGTVENIVKATPEFAAEQGWIEATREVSIGWLYDGQTFTAPEPDPISSEEVNTERDRRIAAGFTWNGNTYQSDADSLSNIAGAATSAVAFMVAGGSPTEVYWADPSQPFVWLTVDNTEVQMTPQDVVAFGNAAMAHKKNHIYAARTLKDMDSTPQDFTNDQYWP